jgi:hypothetical protein
LLVTVAATALVVALCGAGSLSLARQMKLPILGFAPTATIRPTATLEPTATPEPTATATATPTPPQIPKLTLSGVTWVSKLGNSTCTFTGSMTIKNPANGSSMGWIWVDPIQPTPSIFRWALDTTPITRGTLPAQGSLAPGKVSTLNISLSQPCSSATTYSVSMVDTYHRSYPITFTPKYP